MWILLIALDGAYAQSSPQMLMFESGDACREAAYNVVHSEWTEGGYAPDPGALCFWVPEVPRNDK